MDRNTDIIYCQKIGRLKCPRQILLKTMIVKAAVTAIASGRAVLKKTALQKPATLSINERAVAIFSSLVKN